MGREIRKVPPNWEHPKNSQGKYQPMYDSTYEEAANEWIEGYNSFISSESLKYYWEYDLPPEEENHYPNWASEDTRTWFQLFETVSEGTPLSPPFETKKELAEWLASNKDYWCNGPVTLEQAQRFCEVEWVPSMIFSDGKITSGIEIASLHNEETQ